MARNQRGQAMRINSNLAADIKHDFVVRMRSIGKTRSEIQQLVLFLDASLANINDLSKINANK